MAYDSSIISYTTKTDKVDIVAASHINAVQAELVIIENILGTNVKGNRSDLKTRLNNLMDADGSVLSGTSYPSPALGSQLFYKTDVTTLYVHNISSGNWDALGGSLSNVLFSFAGQVDAQGAGQGFYTGTSLVPSAATGNYAFWQSPNDSTYHTKIKTRWVKISGVATVTVKALIWQQGAATGASANVLVDIGGATNNVSGTLNQVTPEWVSFTINVSSLINGTTYDVTIQLKGTASTYSYLGSIIAFGS